MEILYEDLDQEAVYLFNRGQNTMAYEFLGPHKRKGGTSFTLWAPHAQRVELVGDFNHWGQDPIVLKKHGDQGIHQVTVMGTKKYQSYKYRIHTEGGEVLYKADPFAFHQSGFPNFDSKVYHIEDLKKPQAFRAKKGPMNIYEVNLSSWRKYPDGNYYSYEKLAQDLVDYVWDMGYTHIEFMPIMEHPFDGSWGYQITGFFAPTSRFGDPEGFLALVEAAHKRGLGIILDWVPSHFCKDDHGLRYFDGGALYESPNPEEAENKVWGTMTFDLTKPQVRSFLFSNALYYRRVYGVDGLRVDAVAYMLYRGFGQGEVDLEDPANFHQEAIDFIRELNQRLKEFEPDFVTIAEESSAFPKVSHPPDQGGLGFDFKWNMGWMHDILVYMKTDPLMRSGNHKALTFPLMYAFSENYILSISHDEVVHMKGSMVNKMPGLKRDRLQQVRLFMVYMMAHPGKKLNFMGYEFGQEKEWNEYDQLEWELLGDQDHIHLKKFIQSLNNFYLNHEALWENDRTFDGFQWIDADNARESILAFMRKGKEETIYTMLNFTPVDRKAYPFFVEGGTYQIEFSSHIRKKDKVKTQKVHGKEALVLDLYGYEGIYMSRLD